MEKRGMNRKGQLTIFIIIAIVLALILIIVFWPKIKGIVVKTSSNPTDYLRECITEDMEEAIELASKRGGSINPVNSIIYQGEKVEYLCYTNEYYDTCTMQQPMLLSHFEYEVNNYIEDRVIECVNNFKKDFEKRGYIVSVGSVSSSVEIVPNEVVVNINTPVTLTKAGNEKYQGFKVRTKRRIYDFIMLSTSILNWEARYGDSSPESFMMYYPNLKIQKLKQSDGSKIYILSDIGTEESFTFASRSLSWPGGYGIGEIVG